jgi:hypothetical protein
MKPMAGRTDRRSTHKGIVEARFARIEREFNFERSSWKGEPMNVSGSGHELTLGDFDTLMKAFLDRQAFDVFSNTFAPSNGEFLIADRGSLDDTVGSVVAPKSKSEGSHE